jgi:tetratricopeptide (TPR) repeat protein
VKLTILLSALLLSSILLKAQTDSIPSAPILQSPTKEEFYNRGLVLYKAQQFADAILTSDSCLALDSSYTDARYIKAISFEKAGDFQKALNEFERIKKEKPDYPNLDKRIKGYYFTVYLSKYWYYMLTMLLLTVLIITLVVKTVSFRKM